MQFHVVRAFIPAATICNYSHEFQYLHIDVILGGTYVLRIGSVRQKTADISLASGQSIGPRKQREQSSLVTEIIHDRNFRFFWRTELSAFSSVSQGNCQAQFCDFETGASQRDTTSDQRANHRCESIRRVLNGARVSTIRANTSKFVQKRVSVQKVKIGSAWK